MTGLAGDLAHAFRAIRRMPVLGGVVVASLGVGIGLNTVVFSWIQTRMLQPLPGVDHGAAFYGVEPRNRLGQYPGASWLEYQDLSRALTSVPDLIAARMTPLYLGEPGRVERGYAVLVSPNYFEALGLGPIAGRFPTREEAERGAAPIAVISEGLWERQYGRRPGAIGSTLRVNGRLLTVVGVAAREFRGTVPGLFFEVWMPASIAPQVLEGSRELADRTLRGYLLLGRLRSGVTREQAQAELDAVMAELGRTHPDTNADMRAEIAPFWSLPRGPTRMLNAGLGILQAVLLLVLLTICGNTATLMLAGYSGRVREIGVRAALGASRGRIVRLILAEALILAISGAAVGALIAIWGASALRVIPLSALPLRFDATINGTTLLVALLLGLAGGLLVGGAPALQLARTDPQGSLRTGQPAPAGSRLRNALMAVQAALAVMVLIAAGVSLGAYLDTRITDTGFRREGVLLAAYDAAGRASSPAATRAFTRDLLARVRAVPGVEGAAVASSVPLDIHGLPMRLFSVEGRARVEAGQDQATANTVTPGYFDVLDIGLVTGRDFSALDDSSAPPEVVVNEEFVRRFLDGGEAVGRHVVARARTHTIVGVVRNTITNAFGEARTPMIYFSYRDAAFPGGEIHVRSRAGREAAVGQEVRRAVRDLDQDVPVFNVRTLAAHVDSNLVFRRVPARLFAVAAPLLLALAASGVYAVVACSAALRRTEFGVRLAMGATPAALVRQLVRESLVVVGAGAAAGWALALLAARQLLPAAADATVFVFTPVLLTTVAAAASWLPARAASRLDPSAALRSE